METQSLTCLDLILQVEAAGSGGVDWQKTKLRPSQLAVVPGRSLQTFTGGAVKARACRVVRTSLDDSADACCTGWVLPRCTTYLRTSLLTREVA